MSREELLELICPTDATNDCCRGEANFNCRNCEKTLSMWLDEYSKQIRADAIEEFIDKVSEAIIWDILAEIMKRNIGASEGADRIIEYLQKVAEQLKSQNNVN